MWVIRSGCVVRRWVTSGESPLEGQRMVIRAEALSRWRMRDAATCVYFCISEVFGG